jgi:hypothetical protein
MAKNCPPGMYKAMGEMKPKPKAKDKVKGFKGKKSRGK